MKQLLPWLLFGISLCFNLAFLAGAFWPRPEEKKDEVDRETSAKPRPPFYERQMQELVDYLQLSPQERARWQAVLDKHREGLEKAMQEVRERRTAVQEELCRDQPDLDRIRSWMADQTRNDFFERYLAFCLEWMRLLTPEERARVAQWYRSRAELRNREGRARTP